MFLPSRLSTTVSLAPQVDMMRGRGVVKVVHQAERKDAMQQVIVSRNDKEEVWVKTPTGHLLTECFFQAPDEMPEELGVLRNTVSCCALHEPVLRTYPFLE